MTPQQLSDVIHDAQVAFNGGDPWSAPAPFFDQDVRIINPDGTDGGMRAPKDCATQEGAINMSAVLFNVGFPVAIVNYWSQGYQLQVFGESKMVPWLITPDRKQWANAGKCLEHFTHGYSFDPDNPYNPVKAALAEFVPVPAGVNPSAI